MMNILDSNLIDRKKLLGKLKVEKEDNGRNNDQ